MEQIKFRAWDTLQGGKFEYWSFPENNFDGIFWEMIKNKSFRKPEQFSGLFDKNGKELYANDIILKNGNLRLIEHSILDGFHWRTIYDSWRKKNIFKERERSWLSEADSKIYYELIGNIHENPELLKQ